MKSPPAVLPVVDGRLRLELRELAVRLRARRLHRRSARAWACFFIAAAALLGAAWPFSGAMFPALLVLAAGAFILSFWLALMWHREPEDLREAARLIETTHPELGQVLLTALEQQPSADGGFSFLQRRLIERALAHAQSHDWRLRHRHMSPWPQIAHAAAVLAALGVFGLAFRAPAPAGRWTGFSRTATVEVSPGDAEIERGSSVVVAARFGSALPRSTTLEWTDAAGGTRRLPMARSLADPVFAATLPALEHDTVYRVFHDDSATRAYRLSIFELPGLVRADATLDYPDYTRLEDRRFEDTRRVSAVEGTHLHYTFLVNKPLRRAFLRNNEGEQIELTAEAGERTRFTASFTLAQSGHHTLHLEDEAGRTNPDPPDIRIEVLPNRRPELALSFPSGDVRVSPLEEVRLRAGARDDFALLDYGLAFSVGDGAPIHVSRRSPEEVRTAAEFEHLLALETRGAQPGDLVTWFAWADDHSPDGTARRTTSDLYFAEVRPFDEIFREAEGAAPQNQPGQGQQGGEGGELLELQRQISLAIWKLRQEGEPGPEFEADVAAITEGQAQARARLAEAMTQLQEPRQRTSAEQASRFMTEATEHLEDASERRSLDALGEAWTGSQGAYQALLRMQPREMRMAQQRGGNGGQGGTRANQRQLNQLRFRNAEERYETESEAQALASAEEREQIEVLARLRELARRQSDVNDRLQEMQTALAAAEDEAERERLRRELRRLEEEQQRMLADLDDVRQRLERRDSGEQTREARRQLEDTREQMRRSREALQEGALSRALASGTRAREQLEDTRDGLRRETSGRFDEQMREMRRSAQSMAEEQNRLQRELTQMDESASRSLDDSGPREALAERLSRQQEALEDLMRGVRAVAEESEEAEPLLHRQLYDLLRQQDQGETGDRLRTSAELLRRGFVEQSRELQPEVTRRMEELRREIERAAESVLGDEVSTLRFAQRELDDLSRALQPGEADATQPGARAGRDGEARSERQGEEQAGGGSLAREGQDGGPGERESGPREQGGRRPAADRPGSTSTAQAASGQGSASDDELTRALEAFAAGRKGRDQRSPITGENHGEWDGRLRTLESLLDEPGARERLASARAEAERLRAEYRRHGEPPRWAVVESGIVAPLTEVRSWLREEIARREDPQALQPIDRDPVPERFAEAVRKYYEALGGP